MYVVAYLYNTNGMASWCWEAAHALQEASHQVLLVCDSKVKLPGKSKVEILRFDQLPFKVESRSLMSLVSNELGRLSAQSSGFVGQLHNCLQSQGIQPSAYFLNQSNLQDPNIPVSQYVVAWAYPTSLIAYFSKIGQLTTCNFSKQFIRTSMDAIGWWRKDWRAYRSATSVLSVSKQLEVELKIKGVRVTKVYPGTDVALTVQKSVIPRSNPKLLIAAVNLEEHRKGIRWLLEALKKNSVNNYSLTLVGAASDKFKQWTYSDGFPATFTGLVPRSELQKLMADHDIFLFGSAMDDWGYVLVEAMSQGLCVIAPNLHPFNEIIGDSDCLFTLNSKEHFCQKLNGLLLGDVGIKKNQAWRRANQLFSRKAFGYDLMNCLF
jgi:glycosyltransferase involved in cell wall biosynthesis